MKAGRLKYVFLGGALGVCLLGLVMVSSLVMYQMWLIIGVAQGLGFAGVVIFIEEAVRHRKERKMADNDVQY